MTIRSCRYWYGIKCQRRLILLNYQVQNKKEILILTGINNLIVMNFIFRFIYLSIYYYLKLLVVTWDPLVCKYAKSELIIIIRYDRT